GGFPSPAEHAAAVAELEHEPRVSVIETTSPVTSGFSDHANDTIRAAHRAGAAALGDPPLVRPPDAGRKPRLFVLYRRTVEKLGLAELLRRLLGAVAGLVVEWEDREANRTDAADCARAGLELVRCVGPWMRGPEVG